jgi:hypothetical protein
MMRQFIKPSLLGVLLMVCLLVVLATSMRVTSTQNRPPSEPNPVRVERAYGFPPMVRIQSYGPTENEQSPPKVHPQWGTIAAVLSIGWVLTMPVSRWVTGYVRRDGEYAGPHQTGWHQPAATVAYVLAGCLLVGLVGALVMDRTVGAPVPFGEVVLGFVMMLMLLGVPITVIVMLVRRWRHRSRVLQRGFAIEAAPSPAPAG